MTMSDDPDQVPYPTERTICGHPDEPKNRGLSFLSERIILAPSVTMLFAFSEGVICQPSLYF